jgi:hypothetical protein
MDLCCSRTIRIISIIVLSFFLWTFGGVFDIAYAIKTSQQPSDNNPKSQTQKPEQKFEKALEDIRQALADTTTDTNAKKSKIKNKKTEIDSLDVEIKKRFAETEKKLKNANLPGEILQRHYAFVKRYEDNLNELRTNLDAIDKAKTKEEADAGIVKAKAHLERIKPPKKQNPVDPNKLPHRTAQAAKKEPRTKREQFEKEIKKSKVASQTIKPLLVASNGSLKGLVSRNSQPLAQSYLQVAQATDLPTPDDLAQTIEVQFTPAINAQAAALNYNPVQIYNWVRDNIEYAPTYGSIQGADMCMQTKLCNDFDTASLLIALLRTSGIDARYVYGTIQLPIEKVKNWVGGFSDSMAALDLLSSAGVPTTGLTEGGQITYVQMEHVWVEAYINYVPSRGARHKNGHGDTWIRLDASFKQYNYTQGLNIQSAVPFDAQSFINQMQSTATINQTAGYVTNVSSTLVQQTMQDYQTQVQNYISQNYPNATVGDVLLGTKQIITQDFPYLLGTLPYKVIVKGATYTSLPDSLRDTINFSVTKDDYDSITGTPINITKSLPELAGQKITLSYSPATSADEAVINSYLPQPHADGTPIQPSELPSSLPAYLINLQPQLMIDGVVVATGTPVGMGNKETLTITFSGPEPNANELITSTVTTGQYVGIGLDLGRVSPDQITALQTKIQTTQAELQAQDLSNLGKDDIVGDLLYTTALSYHNELGVMKHVSAMAMGVVAITLPSETLFSTELNVQTLFGGPLSASSGGLSMDAQRLITLVKALDGNQDKPIQFLLNSGANSSVLENIVPEQFWSTSDNSAQGVSAIKALQIANDQGIPIYTISQSNISSILPQLQLDSGTIADIQNAVNAGKVVTVSKSDINFDGWVGCGYDIIDPSTGDGAYMIGGGMNGAWIMVAVGNALIVLGLATEEFGVGLALLILGLLYVGIGLCIITESDKPLQFALVAIIGIIGTVTGRAAGEGIGWLIGVLLGSLNVEAGEDMKTFCEGH